MVAWGRFVEPEWASADKAAALVWSRSPSRPWNVAARTSKLLLRVASYVHGVGRSGPYSGRSVDLNEFIRDHSVGSGRLLASLGYATIHGPRQPPWLRTRSSATFGPPRTRCVGLHRRWRIQQRLHDAPLLFDAILSGEPQPPTPHRGLQQDFVGRRTLAALLSEFHIERHGLWFHALGAPSIQRQLYPGGRIELDDKLIRLVGGRGQPETKPRRMLEDQAYFGLCVRQALAAADEERDARPAPVLDVQPECRVRLSGGVGGDAVDSYDTRRTGRGRSGPGRRPEWISTRPTGSPGAYRGRRPLELPSQSPPQPARGD